jgi:hypothetical protein
VGLVRPEEIEAGVIQHALFTTMPWTRNKSTTGSPDKELCFPAAYSDGFWIGEEYIPEGARIRLKSSYNISGMTPEAQIVAQALKTYGTYVGDTGECRFSILFQNLGLGKWDQLYPGLIPSLRTITTVNASGVPNWEVMDCDEFGTTYAGHQLEWDVSPPSTVEYREPISPAIEVSVTGYTGTEVEVMMAIGMRDDTNPGRAELTGTITKMTSGGVAVFDDLEIDRPGLDYVLFAMPKDGEFLASSPFDVTATVGVTDLQLDSSARVAQLSTIPNPIRQATTVRYKTAVPGRASVDIFSVAGRHVRQLLQRAVSPGEYEFDLDRHGLGPGTYFLQLTVQGFTDTQKILFVD